MISWHRERNVTPRVHCPSTISGQKKKGKRGGGRWREVEGEGEGKRCTCVGAPTEIRRGQECQLSLRGEEEREEEDETQRYCPHCEIKEVIKENEKDKWKESGGEGGACRGGVGFGMLLDCSVSLHFDRPFNCWAIFSSLTE